MNEVQKKGLFLEVLLTKSFHVACDQIFINFMQNLFPKWQFEFIFLICSEIFIEFMYCRATLKIHEISIMISYKSSFRIFSNLHLWSVHSNKYHTKRLLLVSYITSPLKNFTYSCGVKLSEKAVMN